MTTTPDMPAILEALAAGHIDAAEAARRIDALKTSQATTDAHTESGAVDEPTNEPTSEPTDEPTSEPTNEELYTAPAMAGGTEDADQDAWAATTDRPQRATYTTESFRPAEPTPEPEPTEPAERVGPKPVNTGGVDRISVRAVGRRVRIIGESSVATLSADGPHVLRRNGSVLEVSSEGEMGASLDGFSILRAAPRNLDDIRSLGLGKELFLRVNPDLIVDVEVTAGSLNTEQVPHLGKIRVTAGGAKLLDIEEINDALVQAGQATIKGSIKTGRSRVRVESGSLNIHLGDDSNVTITSESQLGKVSWTGGHTGAGDEVVMGLGSARLDVEVVMGHAQVKVGSEPKSEAGSR
ncbi:MAG TPA: PT domain-containing protein [Propionibacteriaceae bacterium]